MGMGSRPPSSRGQALCGNNGGRDGSPHTRGQRGEGQQDSSAPLRCARNDMWVLGGWDGFPAAVFTGGMGPRPPSSRGQALRGNNGGRDGSRPPSSRGQDLRGNNGGRDGFPPPVFTGAGSRREDNEGKGRFLGSAALRDDMWVGRMGSRFSCPDAADSWRGQYVRRWGGVPAPVFTGAGSAREQRRGGE